MGFDESHVRLGAIDGQVGWGGGGLPNSDGQKLHRLLSPQVWTPDTPVVVWTRAKDSNCVMGKI